MKKNSCQKSDLENNDLMGFISTSASSEALSLIPEKFAKEIVCLPMSVVNIGDQKVLSVIVQNSFSNEDLQKLKFLSGCEVITEKYNYSKLRKAIESAYGLREDYINTKISEEFSREISSISKKSIPDIPNLLELIVRKSVLINASDIHIEPTGEGYIIRVRVDGSLVKLDTVVLSEDAVLNLSRHIKVISKVENKLVDTAVDGGFDIRVGENNIRLRASILKLINGVKIVLRIIGESKLGKKKDNFSVLGMSKNQEQMLKCILKMGTGTTIICGPTGSGKSTLLNFIANYLSHQNQSIISVEDPVESIVEGVNQIQVDRDNHETIYGILPSVLRQDPDYIFIGEIRDANTAKVALEAGLTGHRVFTTIHAKNSNEVKLRLKNFGIGNDLLNDSISTIINQRLVPLLCVKCKKKSDIHHRINPVLKKYGINQVWDKGGCSHCNYTGYSGRVGVYEFDILEFKKRIITNSKSGEKIGLDDIYTPISNNLKNLVARGKVSYSELMKHGTVL